MDESNERTDYASYNAFSRVALLFGVPIIPLLILAMVTLASGFIGITQYGLVGLMMPISSLALIVFIRVKCRDNSRALHTLWWSLRGLVLRLQCRSSVVSFSTLPNAQKRRDTRVREWIKHHPHSS
ncbi:conjugal transfer protein traD [Vibrio parahaemolyticus]|uniref:conjugal transfer protein traD n=1 Tax=Vibrio parahaemolyticus TaxID=670 RepID=UPI0022B49278|nr:conjugal transfer protein traD [Vibrio parahaemolyticus]MCZ6382008.1 conjugal transfer protein traD [Vibrio parahaemolyticus]MCZ6404370.1 conjugal transfer protein traD [Vibrio parahaemolyticus]